MKSNVKTSKKRTANNQSPVNPDQVTHNLDAGTDDLARKFSRMTASPIEKSTEVYDPITGRKKTRSPRPRPGFLSPVNAPLSSSSSNIVFRPITKSPITMEQEIPSGRSTPSSVGEYLDTMNEDTSDQSVYGQYDKKFYGGRRRKSQRLRTLKRNRRKNKRSRKGRKNISKKSKKSLRNRKKSKNHR